MRKRTNVADLYLQDDRLTNAIRMLDYFSAGVCWQILRLIHNSGNHGKLTVNGRPVDDVELGRLLALPLGPSRAVRPARHRTKGRFIVSLDRILEDLIAVGILAREPQTNILICPEMVEVHRLRIKRIEKGRLGGNPDLLKLQKEKYISDLNRITAKAAEDNPVLNYLLEIEVPPEQQKSQVEEANEIFDFWQLRLNKVNVKFSKARRAKVFARLSEGYSVEDIKQAILGCTGSPRHQGEHECGQKLDDLSMICANRIQLERFIEFAKLDEVYRTKRYE